MTSCPVGFETSDLAVAAFITVRGGESPTVNHRNGRVFFCFRDDARCRELEAAFHGGTERVEPSLYSDALRRMRGVIAAVHRGQERTR